MYRITDKTYDTLRAMFDLSKSIDRFRLNGRQNMIMDELSATLERRALFELITAADQCLAGLKDLSRRI